MIIENVDRLIEVGLKEVLHDLAKLRYDVEWGIIPACHIGGSHKKARVWIVANTSFIGSDECVGDQRSIQDHKEWINQKVQSEWERITVIRENGKIFSERLMQTIKRSCSSKWSSESFICPLVDGLPKESQFNFFKGNTMDGNRITTIKEMVDTGRVIVDFETGQIYSTRIRGKEGEKILLNGCNLKGYIVHGFRYKGVKIPIKAHQIVWIGKHGEFDGEHLMIDHINRIRNDNRLSNLRLVDAKGNSANQDRSHLVTPQEDVDQMIKLFQQGFPGTQIGELMGYSKSRVYQILEENEVVIENTRKQRRFYWIYASQTINSKEDWILGKDQKTIDDLFIERKG